MRFVLNTRSDTAGAQASIFALTRRLQDAGIDATLNDWERYDGYDVAIFMGYDEDLDRARSQNPAIRVGLADPKQSKPEWIDAARVADFLLVSSVEQREAFLRLNRNVFVLYMFPLMPPVIRPHEDREAIVLGYHGNRVHLESMADTVSPAIERLAAVRPVELVCVYDVAGKGVASPGCLPDSALVQTTHVQYGGDMHAGATVPGVVYQELGRADIGLAPNLLPIAARRRALRETASNDPRLAYEPFDHLTRYKASSNPNRLYVFSQLGIPVIADTTPSFAQFVLDGVSGYLAASTRGWFEALERLAGSAARRERMAAALRSRLDEAYDRQIPDLLGFLAEAKRGAPPPVEGEPTAKQDLLDLRGFATPTHSLGRERLRARLSRLLRR